MKSSFLVSKINLFQLMREGKLRTKNGIAKMKNISYKNIIMKICLIIIFLTVNNNIAFAQNNGNWLALILLILHV